MKKLGKLMLGQIISALLIWWILYPIIGETWSGWLYALIVIVWSAFLFRSNIWDQFLGDSRLPSFGCGTAAILWVFAVESWLVFALVSLPFFKS